MKPILLPKPTIVPLLLLLGGCASAPRPNQPLPPFDLNPHARLSPSSASSTKTIEYQPASYHPVSTRELHPVRHNRTLYMGAGLAALNNPRYPSGDVDNTSVTFGGKAPLGKLSLRPEVQLGERSKSFNTTLSRDFNIAGNGLGSIEGNLGVGYTVNTGNENNVLGNANSAFLRVGAEGHLAGNIVTGMALMIAPQGYNGEDTAMAGVGYMGFSF